MADLNQTFDPLSIGISQIVSSLPEGLHSKLETMLNIGTVLLIIAIAYFVILIISKILNVRASRNVIKIAENVEQINHKLDFLVGKKKKN